MNQLAASASIKLKKKEIVSYGLGNAAQNMAFMMISTYMLIFYTDIFGITAAAAGTLFLIARIFDAINDPLMGFIADRTQTKWGKFRPYLLFGTVPLAIATVLLFTTPNFGSTGKLVYAYITYLLQGICFTVVLIPWFSLPAAMTQSTEERSRISIYSNVIAVFAVIIVSVSTIPIVSAFETPQLGYSVVTTIYMLIMIVLFFFCFKNTREHVVVNRESYNFKKIYVIIGKNKELIILSLGYIFFTINYALRMAGATYYAKYNLNNESLSIIILGGSAVVSVIGTLLCSKLLSLFGKRKTYLYGITGCFVSSIILFFIPYSMVYTAIVFIYASSFFCALPLTATWAMVPDTVDYGEWKSGFRAEGATAGAFSFVQKLASALAGSVSGLILTIFGYVANAKQTADALSGINIMVSLVPGICCAICFIIMFFYSLTENRMHEIVEELSSRTDQ